MIISKEFIMYCAVGVFNTLAGISAAFVCLNILLTPYSVATAVAYIVGIIVSFFLNKKFTFKNTDKAGMQFVKFFFSMLPAYIISYGGGFYIAEFLFGIDFLSPLIDFAVNFTNFPPQRLSDNSAILISMILYLIVGFSINKFYVFVNKK